MRTLLLADVVVAVSSISKRSIVACAALVAVASVGITACGNPPREEQLSRFDAPSGAFSVLFLSPPWMVEQSDDAYLRLEIEATGTRLSDIDPALLPPKYLLEASVEGGNARTRALADERAAIADPDEEVLVGPLTFATSTGGSGWELTTELRVAEGSRFRRFVYFEREMGVVRLYFEGNPDLRSAEIDAMIDDTRVEWE